LGKFIALHVAASKRKSSGKGQKRGGEGKKRANGCYRAPFVEKGKKW